MKKYYAGIGSRKTPMDVLKRMTEIAEILAGANYRLRSGGAEGADTAFEKGAGKLKEILRPKHATPEALKVAASVHPAWGYCNDYARSLHGRNVQIILGVDLEVPVEFVVCWTPEPIGGGTKLGIDVAQKNQIPVYNLFNPKECKPLNKLLESWTAN